MSTLVFAIPVHEKELNDRLDVIPFLINSCEIKRRCYNLFQFKCDVRRGILNFSRRATYQGINLKIVSVSGVLDFLSGNPAYFNDLEKPAFEINPELAQLKKSLLKRGFKVVLMSGSGSAFFYMGQGEPPKQPGLTLFPAQYVNRSLFQWYQER